MKKSAGLLFSLFVVICFCVGCVIAPRPQVAVAQPAELDYVGEATPLAVVEYPGVAFYPRYVGEEIVPVAFVGGVWINERGVRIVHEGAWRHPPQHVVAKHREVMRTRPNMYRRMNNPPKRPKETKPAVHQQTRPQQTRPQQTPQTVRPPQQKVPAQQQKKAPPCSKEDHAKNKC